MSYTGLVLEKKDKIGYITLNRPEIMNAFNAALFQELITALLELDADDSIKVVVITGAGRAFSAGMDLVEAKKGPTEFDTQVVPLQNTLSWTGHVLRAMKKPIIAAINGAAVGAGFTVSIGCDIRIMADTAKIGTGFLRVGLVPELGSSYSLPRLVGIAKACELVFASRILDAKEAKEIGLVNEVVPAADLMTYVNKMAAEIAEMPTPALQMARKLLYHGLDSSLDAQLQFEQTCQSICLKSYDHEEGMKAILEKRKPEFKGK